MRISCITLDLDRTTLNAQGRLSERNRKAIESAIARGIEVVIASGRSLHALPQDVCAIAGIRYAITSNGASVYDLRTGECLRQFKLTEESVREILRQTACTGVSYEAFIDGQAYAERAYVEDPVRFGALPAAIPYIQSTRIPVEPIDAFLLTHARELDSLDLVVRSEQEKQKLWKLLEKTVSDIYLTSSVEQLLEISYRDSGKHSGAKYILERLGLPDAALAAFGDGDNDAEMLRLAGIGFAVANATPGCRAAADRIVPSNEEDGVACGIAQILRENEGRE